MTPERLRQAIGGLGLTVNGCGRLLGHPGGGAVRKWLRGAHRVPPEVARFLRWLEISRANGSRVAELLDEAGGSFHDLKPADQR